MGVGGTNKSTRSSSTVSKRGNLPPSSRAPWGSARLRAEQDFANPRPRGGSRGRPGESPPALRRPRPDLAPPYPDSSPPGLHPSAPWGSCSRPRHGPPEAARPASQKPPRVGSAAGPPTLRSRRITSQRSRLCAPSFATAGLQRPPGPPQPPLNVAQLLRRGPGKEEAWRRRTWTPSPGRRAPCSRKRRRHLVADASSSRCFKTSFKALSSPSSPSPGRPLAAGASRSGGTTRTTHERPLPRPLGLRLHRAHDSAPTGLVPLSIPKAPVYWPERLGPAYHRHAQSP